MEAMIIFSVTPSKVANSVAILHYAIDTEREMSNGNMVCHLREVTWNEGAKLFYKEATVREVPISILYRKGAIPEAFNPWVKTGCTVRDISKDDVGFDTFWSAYAHKVGNKTGVKKKWDKLEWEDKVYAIGSIRRLRNYYQSKGYDMPYPETYIDQRRWENIFES